MQTAARVARTFRFDPLTMLLDGDEFHWAAWVAMHNVVMQDEKDAADKAKSKTPKVAGSRSRR